MCLSLVNFTLFEDANSETGTHTGTNINEFTATKYLSMVSPAEQIHNSTVCVWHVRLFFSYAFRCEWRVLQTIACENKLPVSSNVFISHLLSRATVLTVFSIIKHTLDVDKLYIIVRSERTENKIAMCLSLFFFSLLLPLSLVQSIDCTVNRQTLATSTVPGSIHLSQESGTTNYARLTGLASTISLSVSLFLPLWRAHRAPSTVKQEVWERHKNNPLTHPCPRLQRKCVTQSVSRIKHPLSIHFLSQFPPSALSSVGGGRLTAMTHVAYHCTNNNAYFFIFLTPQSP